MDIYKAIQENPRFENSHWLICYDNGETGIVTTYQLSKLQIIDFVIIKRIDNE